MTLIYLIHRIRYFTSADETDKFTTMITKCMKTQDLNYLSKSQINSIVVNYFLTKAPPSYLVKIIDMCEKGHKIEVCKNKTFWIERFKRDFKDRMKDTEYISKRIEDVEGALYIYKKFYEMFY